MNLPNLLTVSRLSGKLKVVVQAAVIIGVALLDVLQATILPGLQVRDWSFYAMAAVAVVTTLSLIDYVHGSRQLLRATLVE